MANKKDRQESLPTKTGVTFKVGEGVHWGFNGDAYPGTVLFVSDSGRKVYVSDDEFKIIDDLGGYVEGERECEFKTVQRPIEECTVWTLRSWGQFTRKAERTAWFLKDKRAYSRNPSF